MVTSPTHSRLHLLSAKDLKPGDEPSAELISPDGDHVRVNAAVWAIVEHVLACASHDLSVFVEPVESVVGLGDAARLTGIEEQHLRQLIIEDGARLRSDAMGELVATEDLAAVANRERARRSAALADYNALSDDIRDDFDGI